MNDQRSEAEAKQVRPRGARLWRVLVVGGMALATACAGGCAGMQKSGNDSGASSGASGGPSGGGTGGW